MIPTKGMLAAVLLVTCLATASAQLFGASFHDKQLINKLNGGAGRPNGMWQGYCEQYAYVDPVNASQFHCIPYKWPHYPPYIKANFTVTFTGAVMRFAIAAGKITFRNVTYSMPAVSGTHYLKGSTAATKDNSTECVTSNDATSADKKFATLIEVVTNDNGQPEYIEEGIFELDGNIRAAYCGGKFSINLKQQCTSKTYKYRCFANLVN